MIRPTYDQKVFRVRDPPCGKCHKNDLDFKLYENYDGTGIDWVQWYCILCGHYTNVEIL